MKAMDVNGQVTGLEKAFEEHRPKLLAMVQRRLDPALSARVGADDVLQQVFLLARKRWSAYQQQREITPYAWLYRLTLDCLIETWRTHNRNVRQVGRDMPWPAESALQLGLGLVASGTSPSKAIERQEIQRGIQEALDAMRPSDRQILWMRHFDQLSFKEIAQVLDITQTAANVRYVRALEKLKTIWKRSHPNEDLTP
jgi:RNA polymerase sigma-70 factor (ECF subfamily)